MVRGTLQPLGANRGDGRRLLKRDFGRSGQLGVHLSRRGAGNRLVIHRNGLNLLHGRRISWVGRRQRRYEAVKRVLRTEMPRVYKG